MTLEMFGQVLLWCFVINFALLLFWWLLLLIAHDWIYKFHGQWFNLSEDRFNAIHYQGMLLYKLANFMLFLVPWIALLIVR